MGKGVEPLSPIAGAATGNGDLVTLFHSRPNEKHTFTMDHNFIQYVNNSVIFENQISIEVPWCEIINVMER